MLREAAMSLKGQKNNGNMGVLAIASKDSSKELQINEEIRDKEIRVIGADGAQLGLMSARDAQKLAIEKDLDLVKIAPQATPPVCKIMDYGKYCFEQSKREKEAKKNQKIVEIKEIRMFSNIDTHDFETKAAQARSLARSFLINSRRLARSTALSTSPLKWRGVLLLCS